MEGTDGMRTINTAIVTGPTGGIGHALCSRLLREGITVYAVAHPGSPRAATLPDGLLRIDCDLSEMSRLPQLVPGADALFHLAWAKTVGAGRNDMYAQTDNIRYTLDVCRAAAALGCKVFVGAGSQAEYGRTDGALTPETPCFPESGYGMAKLCAGQMSRIECEKLGIAHVWPRILSVYGPFCEERSMLLSTARLLLAGKKPSLTAGEQLWDYLYVDDAAEALYRVALYGHSGRVYPIGSGKVCPLRAYVEILRDAVDPALPLGFGEVPYGAGQLMHLEADTHALEKDTGFQPKIDFAEGVRRMVEWMRGNGDA